MSATRTFGCLPSPADHRDYPARAFLAAAPAQLPESFVLPLDTPAYDQGSTGMCVDFSIRTLKEVQESSERGYRQALANGYIYGNRGPGDWQGEGMYPREALTTLVRFGIPPASVFTHVGTYEDCRAAYQAARELADGAAVPQRIRSYVRCWTTEEAQRALVELRSPLLLAAAVTRKFAFWTSLAGVVADQPQECFEPGHPEYLGGHAMIVYGYRVLDGRLHWRVRNSWGEEWGENGDCWMPVDWLGIWELWAATDANSRGRTIELTIGIPEIRTLTLTDDQEHLFTLALDAAPLLRDGRAFLPFRALGETLGGVVDWIPSRQLVTFSRGSVSVELEIGSRAYLVNGEPREMDVAPFLAGGRTMVPVRFVAEALGYVPAWNPNTNVVTIREFA